MAKDSWWNQLDLMSPLEDHKVLWYRRAHFASSCENKQPIYRSFFDGYVKEIDIIINHIVALDGGRLSQSAFYDTHMSENFFHKLFIFEHGLVEIESHRFDKGSFNFDVVSNNKEFIKELTSFIKKHSTKIPPQGEVKMLTTSSEGYDLTTLGRIDCSLVKENYSEDVISKYEHIIEEIGSPEPCGRFVLLTGESGTGKSYFIRGILSQAKAWFVFVPSSMVGSLSGPEIASVLLNNSEEREGLPIVLIIEDADTSLTSRGRETSNVNQISSLLNLGDGLLGELADIRVIATTNVTIRSIDPAIIRPGRLCEKIEFNKLSKEQAAKVYKQLTGSEESNISKSMTLAEVYKMARKDGWKPQPKEEVGGNYL
jgi:hypothetical protein